MNNHQLLSEIQERQRQLSAMRQLLVAIEFKSDDAFNSYDDQWPDSLVNDLNLLRRMYRRFQESMEANCFLDYLVAGRPHVADLAVDVAAAAKRASNGFAGVADALNEYESPSSGFTTWHWFEHAIRAYLVANSRLMSAAKDLLQLELDSGDQNPADPMHAPSQKNIE